MKIVYLSLLGSLFFCCDFSKDTVSNDQKEKKEIGDTVSIGKAIDYFIPTGKTCVQYQTEASSAQDFKHFVLKASASELISSDSVFYEGSPANINRRYYTYTDTEVNLTRLHYSPGQGGMNGEKNIVYNTPITLFKIPKKGETLKWTTLDYDNKDTIKFTASWKTMTVNSKSQQVIRITEWKSYLSGAYGVSYYAKGLGLFRKVAEDMQGNEVYPTTIKGYCK